LCFFQIQHQTKRKIILKKFGHTSFFRLLAALLIFSASALSQAENITPSAALNTAKSWSSAVEQADISGLNELLRNNYQHIHATELEDGKIYTLNPGKSYQVADKAEAHRSKTDSGTTLFLVG
jgi:hypothetical protein